MPPLFLRLIFHSALVSIFLSLWFYKQAENSVAQGLPPSQPPSCPCLPHNPTRSFSGLWFAPLAGHQVMNKVGKDLTSGTSLFYKSGTVGSRIHPKPEIFFGESQSRRDLANSSCLLLICNLKGRKASFSHLVLGPALAFVLLYPSHTLQLSFFFFF